MGSLEDCAELKEDVSHVLCCAACVSHLVDRATPRSSPKESFAFQGALCYLQQEGMGCQSGPAIVPCNENLEQAGLIKVLYLGDTIRVTKPGLFSGKGCVRGFLLGLWGVCSQCVLA